MVPFHVGGASMIKTQSLSIDLDHLGKYCNCFLRLIERYQKVFLAYGIESTGFEVWDTKHGHHIEIGINLKIPIIDSIFLQALCGSDPMRELTCWVRLQNGAVYPRRLFEIKNDFHRKPNVVMTYRLNKKFSIKFPFIKRDRKTSEFGPLEETERNKQKQQVFNTDDTQTDIQREGIP